MLVKIVVALGIVLAFQRKKYARLFAYGIAVNVVKSFIEPFVKPVTSGFAGILEGVI